MTAPPPAPSFSDNRAAADWTRRLAWLQAALAAVIAAFAYPRLGAGPDKSAPDLAAPDLAFILLTAQLLLFLAGGALALRWLYVASRNARALGAADMMVSPGWAVGWYFVPLANLVMPLVTIRELWRASANPRDWQAVPAPAWTILWWLFWLASNIAGMAAFRFEWEGDPDLLEAVGIAQFASDILFVPAALLFAAIVGGIQAMQDERAPGQPVR